MELIVETLYDGTGAGAYNGRRFVASSIYRTKEMPLSEGGIFVLPEEMTSINWVEDPDVKYIGILSSKYGVKRYTFGSFLRGRTREFNEGEIYGNESKCIEILGLEEEQLVQLAKEFLVETLNHAFLVKVYKTNRLLRICKCFQPVSGKYFKLKSIPESVLVCRHLDDRLSGKTGLLIKDKDGKFIEPPTEEKMPIDTIIDEISGALCLNRDYSFCIKGEKVAVLFPKMSGNYELVKAYMRQFSYVPKDQEALSIRGREWLSVLFRFSDSKRLAGKYRNGDVVLFRSDQPGGHLLRMFGHLSEEEAKRPTTMSEYVGEIFDDGGEDGRNRRRAIYSIRTLIPVYGFLSITYEDDIIRIATKEDKNRLKYR